MFYCYGSTFLMVQLCTLKQCSNALLQISVEVNQAMLALLMKQVICGPQIIFQNGLQLKTLCITWYLQPWFS